MTGKIRHLSRDSPHRQAMLRNMVQSLFNYETIQTTWAKAKEAQRLAEKVVTLAKRNTPAAEIRMKQIFFTPEKMMSKLFGEIRTRYENRPGGYTRVLKIEPIKEDQAESAILELVDSPRDMRFNMTARTVAHLRREGKTINEITQMNIDKVTRHRNSGKQQLESLVQKYMKLADEEENHGVKEPQKVKVYHDAKKTNRDRKKILGAK